MRYDYVAVVVISASCLGLGPMHGQGTITFANLAGAGGVNAPIYLPDCMTGVSGPEFLAVLYAGPAGSLEPQLMLVGRPTPFYPADPGAGYFGGGIVSIPDISPGVVGAFQVRVYEAAAGSYEAAVAGLWLHGKSNLFETQTGYPGHPGGPPMPLTGLQSFCLVPEPSTLGLMVGGGLLLAGRWIWRGTAMRWVKG
jgi:hypothetical protein